MKLFFLSLNPQQAAEMLDDRNLETCCAEQWKWLPDVELEVNRPRTKSEDWVRVTLENRVTLGIFSSYCHLEFKYRNNTWHHQEPKFNWYFSLLCKKADHEHLPVVMRVVVPQVEQDVRKAFRGQDIAKAYQQHYLHSAESWNAVWTKREVPEFYRQHLAETQMIRMKNQRMTFAIN